MSDTFLNSISLKAPGWTSEDGLILDVNTGDLGNSDTSYTYIDLLKAGFDSFALDYVITSTTLTIEGSNDDDSYGDNDNELIYTTNDRTFAGSGNWDGDSGGTVVVNGGKLEVTAGPANSGAQLSHSFFNRDLNYNNRARGFVAGQRYTLVITSASISAGTISILCGSQVLASGLTAATHTITFLARVSGPLRIIASNAAATWTLDNASIKRISKVWSDITLTATEGAASTITATGSFTRSNPLPWRRLRFKRATTNATNALELRLVRYGPAPVGA